jgi:hypothetical protein
MTAVMTPGEAHLARCGAAQRDCLSKIAKAMDEYRAQVYASHERYTADQRAEDEQKAKIP